MALIWLSLGCAKVDTAETPDTDLVDTGGDDTDVTDTDDTDVQDTSRIAPLKSAA